MIPSKIPALAAHLFRLILSYIEIQEISGKFLNYIMVFFSIKEEIRFFSFIPWCRLNITTQWLHWENSCWIDIQIFKLKFSFQNSHWSLMRTLWYPLSCPGPVSKYENWVPSQSSQSNQGSFLLLSARHLCRYYLRSSNVRDRCQSWERSPVINEVEN